MGGTADKVAGGITLVLALIVVFIGAGRAGGQSGGRQTADVINAGGGQLNGLAKIASGQA